MILINILRQLVYELTDCEPMHRDAVLYFILTVCLGMEVASIVLVDLSDTHRHGKAGGGFDKSKFWWGIGLGMGAAVCAYIIALWYFVTLAHRVEAKVKRDGLPAPSALLTELKVYFPLYIATLFVMTTAGLYQVFHLDAWSVAIGACLLGFGFLLALVFYLTSAKNISKLAQSVGMDAD